MKVSGGFGRCGAWHVHAQSRMQRQRHSARLTGPSCLASLTSHVCSPQSVHDEPLTLHDTRLARTLHSAQTATLECSMQLQCEWKYACRRVCNVGVLVCVQCGTTRLCHGCVGALQLLMCVLLDKLAPVLCGAGDVCREAVQGRCRDRGAAPVGNTREAWESRRGVITRRGASAV